MTVCTNITVFDSVPFSPGHSAKRQRLLLYTSGKSDTFSGLANAMSRSSLRWI